MLSGDASPAQGQQGTFYHMLRHFSTHWDRVDILCPRAPDATPRTIHDNVHLHPSPWPRLLQPVFIARRGHDLLAARDYALIVSHDFGLFYNGIGAWWLARQGGVPYVSELHHVEGYPRAVTWRERVYRALAMRYIRWVWRRAAAIRVVNQGEMPALLRAQGVPDDKILVLSSLYIDFDVFKPLPDAAPRYDVLFVGRLASNKGLPTILAALAQVRQTHPDVRLGIRGDGPLRPQVEQQIAALGLAAHVAFIPRVAGPDDLARLYNQARMLVCASTAEGGPRVTVEAMACGTPVISTPVGVMADLMEDGKSLLVFHWDADELAAKIRLLLDREIIRQQLGHNGQAAVQGFEAEAVIGAYARGYQALVQRLRG